MVEVPSFEVARVAGEAKLQTFSAGWTILKAILRERTVPAPGRGATKPARRPPVSVPVYGTGRSDPWLERLAPAKPAAPAAPAASTTGPELVGTSVDRRELGGWPARTFNEATGELVETRSTPLNGHVEGQASHRRRCGAVARPPGSMRSECG